MKASRWLTITLVLFLTTAVAGQNTWTPRLRVDVPFGFVVNGTVLPEGNYLVSAYSSGNMIRIQNIEDPKYVATAMNINLSLAETEAVHERGRLIFGMNHGQYTLHQICIPSDNHTHDIAHGSDVDEVVTHL